MAFDSMNSELAMATGDGRVRLFNVIQQRLSADITQTLSSASGGRVATEIYSCMAWGGGGKVSFKNIFPRRRRQQNYDDD